MTLHFNLAMIIGLGMIPGGLIIGVLLVVMLARAGKELGAFAGMIPGVVIAVAGVAVFLVGLGMELR